MPENQGDLGHDSEKKLRAMAFCTRYLNDLKILLATPGYLEILHHLGSTYAQKRPWKPCLLVTEHD